MPAARHVTGGESSLAGERKRGCSLAPVSPTSPSSRSLPLSTTFVSVDLTSAAGTGQRVGLKNYGDLLRDPLFLNAARNSAVMVASTVTIQVVLRVAFAMFFNLHLKGSAIVRAIVVLPMLLTPIVAA